MKPLKAEDIKIGEKFGKLTLISHQMIGKYRKGIFICECGNETIKHYSHVKRGLTTSCGCFQREGAALRRKTHGMTKTNEFTIWQGMISRCHSTNNPKYYRYGARGIVVCDRWKNSFENFFLDMGKRPSKRHSIERNDNDGNYTPDNCRWDIPYIQARNSSKNHFIEHNGRKMILQDWADELGYSQSYLCKMLKNNTIEKIVLKSKKDGRSPILFRRNKNGNILSKTS